MNRRVAHHGVAIAALAGLLAGCASPPAPTQRRAVSMAEGKCTQPPYPPEARASQAEGTTTLEFEVNAEGKVTRVAIVGASGGSAGHRVLDGLALETLNKCSFPAAPGFLPATSRVSYVWRLRD